MSWIFKKTNLFFKAGNEITSVPHVEFSCRSVAKLYLTLRSHGLQHIRLPSPSPTPGACSNSCPLSQWCHPIISSSVALFSACPQSFLASGFFPMSQLFASDGQSIGVSASVLSMNIQGWFPFGLTAWSLCCPRDSQVFSSIIFLKPLFLNPQAS